MPPPVTYVVRITPRALRDLRLIFDEVNKDSPQNAPQVIQTVLAAVDRLDTFPHRYAIPRTGAARNQNVRSMPVMRYLVRYRIEENAKAVHIVRIRHGARRRP